MNENKQKRRLNILYQHIKDSNPILSPSETNNEATIKLIDNRFTPDPYIFTNWAKIHSCIPRYVHFPEHEKEIIDIIKYANKNKERVKVVGSGHSPNNMCLTRDHLINLNKYNKILNVNGNKVTVQSGIRLFELNELLPKYGLALPNLGSISEQSISGAISTGTHGTGIGYGCLATIIEDMTLIDGNGNVLYLSENSNKEIFKAALCGIGALGIISTLTLNCVKDFNLHSIQVPMKLNYLLNNLTKLLKENEFYRFWFFPHTDYCVSWRANKIDKLKRQSYLNVMKLKFAEKCDKFFNIHIFEFFLYIAIFVPRIINIINKLYFYITFNRKIEIKDKSHKVLNFDCKFSQFVNEWAIPIEKTAEALYKLNEFINTNKLNVHFPIEVRFVKGDDIYLSPSYGRDSCWIGIIMYRPYGLNVDYIKYFLGFEKIMHEMGGRPHWAKEFSLNGRDFSKMYEKWNDFKIVREKCDPNKIFWNEYLENVFKE